MRQETIFYTSPLKPRSGSCPPVRLDGDLYDQVNVIARKCRLPITEVVSRIIRDGLPFVRLVEAPLYELKTGGDEDDA